MRVWAQRGFAMLVLASVILANNLHLPVVQIVAWTRMYSAYRQHYPPALAFEVVFSGKALCPLCKFVRDAQKEQHVLAGSLAGTFKVLLPLSGAGVQLTRSEFAGWDVPEPARAPASWLSPPEPPPPRWAGLPLV